MTRRLDCHGTHKHQGFLGYSLRPYASPTTACDCQKIGTIPMEYFQQQLAEGPSGPPVASITRSTTLLVELEPQAGRIGWQGGGRGWEGGGGGRGGCHTTFTHSCLLWRYSARPSHTRHRSQTRVQAGLAPSLKARGGWELEPTRKSLINYFTKIPARRCA